MGSVLLCGSVSQNHNVKQFSGAAPGQDFYFQPCASVLAADGSTCWHLGIPGPLGSSFLRCGHSSFFSKLAVCPAQPVLICLPRSLLLPDNQHRASSGCSHSRLTLGIAEACSWSAIKEKLKSFLPVFQNSPEGQMFPSAPVRNSIQIHFWENLRVLSPFSIGLESTFCFLPCTALTGNK